MQKVRAQIVVATQLDELFQNHRKVTKETLSGFLVRAALTTIALDREQIAGEEVTMSKKAKPGWIQVVHNPHRLSSTI